MNLNVSANVNVNIRPPPPRRLRSGPGLRNGAPVGQGGVGRSARVAAGRLRPRATSARIYGATVRGETARCQTTNSTPHTDCTRATHWAPMETKMNTQRSRYHSVSSPVFLIDGRDRSMDRIRPHSSEIVPKNEAKTTTACAESTKIDLAAPMVCKQQHESGNLDRNRPGGNSECLLSALAVVESTPGASGEGGDHIRKSASERAPRKYSKTTADALPREMC